MIRDRYHKNLFTIASIWNWLFALSGIMLVTIYKNYVTLFLTEAPNSAMFSNLFFSLVFTFGIGYYWISRNTIENRSIIKLGIIGKVFVFVLVLVAYFTKEVTILTVLGGVGDLIFSIFFIEVLTKLPEPK